MNTDPYMTATAEQVEDDLNLLYLMVEDMKKEDVLYHPTNYWSVYEKHFLPELESVGLRDFRQRRESVLSSFGGASLARRPPLNRKWLHWLSQPMKKKIGNFLSHTAYYKQVRQQVLHQYVESADSFGKQHAAAPLTSVTLPLVGHPQEYTEVNGRFYDLLLINTYLLYAWTARFIKYDEVKIYAELGSGLGTQALLMKQLYPQMTILLFDLPTQLYVCEQYLKSIFPDELVSYRSARMVDSLQECKPGGIYCFGAYQFPMLKNYPVDLFWNAASFQEMEPAVVVNYLGQVSNARWIALRETLYGKEVAAQQGVHGVLKKTTYADYVNILSSIYELSGLQASNHFEDPGLDLLHYCDSVWENKHWGAT